MSTKTNDIPEWDKPGNKIIEPSNKEYITLVELTVANIFIVMNYPTYFADNGEGLHTKLKEAYYENIFGLRNILR